MSSLRIDLSPPEAVERFRDVAHALLEWEKGELSDELKQRLVEKAQDMGVHPLDRDTVLAEVAALPSIQALYRLSEKANNQLIKKAKQGDATSLIRLSQQFGIITREQLADKEGIEMYIQVLDIGGSGVKTALFLCDGYKHLELIEPVVHYENPDWPNFEVWLQGKINLDAKLIGISCAGFVNYSSNTIQLFRIGNWRNKPIKNDFEKAFQGTKIFLLNDAEAHLMAHNDLLPHSQLCISIGTSLGFAISDRQGKIIRPPDNMNFDLGALAIPTRTTNNRVWWALGSHGMEELQNNMGHEDGIKHFGYRLGAFLASLCSIFRPDTVVLSGGITESYWNLFEENLRSEFKFNKPDWLPEPQIINSPYGREAGLWGIAKYVLREWPNLLSDPLRLP